MLKNKTYCFLYHLFSICSSIFSGIVKVFYIDCSYFVVYQYFGHLMQRVDSLEKTLMLEGGLGQEEKGMTEDEMAG